MENQTPEQKARDLIDKKLVEAGRVCISTIQRMYSILRGEELDEKLEAYDNTLSPANVWRAFSQLGVVKTPSAGKSEPALVALVRYVAKIDRELTPFAGKVDANFQAWTFRYNAAHPGAKLTDEQMSFLRMIRDHVSSSFYISQEDMEYAPFDTIGGPFMFRTLFGDRAEAILDDLNAALAA